MQKTIIESSTEIDLYALLNVFNAARSSANGLPDHDVSLNDFKVMIEGEKILIAKVNSEIVGFASVWEQDNFVHHLFVAPSHQNQGTGAALLKTCHDTFGLPLTLKCVEENSRACEFYEKNGWEPIEKAIDVQGPYILYRLNNV